MSKPTNPEDAAVTGPESRPQPLPLGSGQGPARVFFLIVLVSLLTSAGSIWTYDRYFAQKVVAVDLKGFLDAQKDQFIRGAIDEIELERRIDGLERTMDAIPSRYAVLLGDVVVRHVKVIEP